MAFVVAQHAGAGMRFSSSDRGEAKEEAKEEEIKRRAVTKLWKEGGLFAFRRSPCGARVKCGLTSEA
jgi:hypothetical protein